MINVRISGITTPHMGESRVPNRGTVGFWMLFALEALFVAGVLALVLILVLPPRAAKAAIPVLAGVTVAGFVAAALRGPRSG